MAQTNGAQKFVAGLFILWTVICIAWVALSIISPSSNATTTDQKNAAACCAFMGLSSGAIAWCVGAIPLGIGYLICSAAGSTKPSNPNSQRGSSEPTPTPPKVDPATGTVTRQKPTTGADKSEDMSLGVALLIVLILIAGVGSAAYLL